MSHISAICSEVGAKNERSFPVLSMQINSKMTQGECKISLKFDIRKNCPDWLVY